MSETARTVIDDSLSLLGVLGQGESATPDDYSKALRFLNNMMANWSVTRAVPNRIEKEFQMVSGQSTYGLGDSEDWDPGGNPINVYAASLLQGGSGRVNGGYNRDPDETTTKLISRSPEWFADHDSFVSFPESYWFKRWDDDSPGDSTPGGRITFDGSGNDLWVRLYLEMPFGTWELSDLIRLPAEYMEPIKYHLALRLVTPFYADLTNANAQLLATIAGGSKDIVDSINLEVPEVDVDISLQGGGRFVNINGPIY